MDKSANVGGRDRLARAALAVALTVAAVRSLRNGRRLRSVLAGAGALAFGFNATTGYCGANDALGIDTTGTAGTATADSRGDGEATGAPTADGTQITGTAAGDSENGTATAGTLTCAACGEPIVPGQRRSPSGNGQTVHDGCK